MVKGDESSGSLPWLTMVRSLIFAPIGSVHCRGLVPVWAVRTGIGPAEEEMTMRPLAFLVRQC